MVIQVEPRSRKRREDRSLGVEGVAVPTRAEGQNLAARGRQVGELAVCTPLGRKAKAEPWWCPGNPEYKCHVELWVGGRHGGRAFPLSSAAKHLQSINGLINSLQRPLNYSSWATERTIRAH